MSGVRTRCRRAVGSVLLAAAGVAVVGAGVCGVRLTPVLTGSMAPSAPAGSLVLTVPVAGEDVAVGDVLAFRPPAPYEVVDGRPVLHRVAEVDADAEQPWMRTRGDANAQADPWRFRLDAPTQARAAFHVPHVGRALALASDRTLRMIGVGIPALFIVLATFARLWRDAGAQVERRDAGAQLEGSPA